MRTKLPDQACYVKNRLLVCNQRRWLGSVSRRLSEPRQRAGLDGFCCLTQCHFGSSGQHCMNWRIAATEPRKALSLAGAALVLCLAAPANAGEEVHFSDSSTNLPPSRSVKSDSPVRRSFDIFRGHNNSMGPAVARPFMPMEAVVPRTLTPSERKALDQKKNWMFNNTEGSGITDQSAAEAFHVRSERWGETSAQTPSMSSGSIVRYVEKSRANDQTGERPSRSTLDNDDNPLSAAHSDLSTSFKSTDLVGPPGIFSTRGSSLDVDSSASYRAPSDQNDSWSGRVKRALMDSFTSTSGNSGMGQSGQNRTATDDLFSTRSVVGNALANDMSPARNLADPLSLSPDRTKEALNPVVGGTSDLAGNARFGEIQNSLPQASGVIRSRLNGSVSSSAISSSEGTFKSISAPQPSRIQTTPLVLDVPRRTF